MNALVKLLVLANATSTLFSAQQKATVVAHSHSISLHPFTVTVPGVGIITQSFTSFDGRTDRLPLFLDDGVLITFSGELRPRAGAIGTYETDYVRITSSSVEDYGSMAVAISTTDSRQIGAPDFVQRAFGVGLNFTGTISADGPAAYTSSITGTLKRDAGSTTGTYSATSSRSTNTFDGIWSISHLEGTMEYERSETTTAHLAITLTMVDGSSVALSTDTDYDILSPDEIQLPAFVLKGRDNAMYQTRATTRLRRSAQTYMGTLQMVDGDSRTPWADFEGWTIEIRDNNDTDRDGIPDVSEKYVPPNILVLTDVKLGGGQPTGRIFSFRIPLVAGFPYTIWRSTDCATWTIESRFTATTAAYVPGYAVDERPSHPLRTNSTPRLFFRVTNP